MFLADEFEKYESLNGMLEILGVKGGVDLMEDDFIELLLVGEWLIFELG